MSKVTYERGQTDVFFSDSTLHLPWYVKTYWVLFVVTVPAAFFITAFYYIMLFDNAGELHNYILFSTKKNKQGGTTKSD